MMDKAMRPLTLFYILIVLFLFFPILIVVPISFSNGRFLSFPPEEFGLRWYREYFQDPIWISATLRSVRVAISSSLAAVFVGTLVVIGLGRRRTRKSGALTSLFLAPAIVPNIIVALGVFILAIKVGLPDNELTLIAAHTAICLPFVILIVGSAYRQIDPTLEKAARIMGAGPVRAFMAATFPALAPSFIAASIFAFFISFDELIISLFVMSSAETLPMRIWNDLRFEINPTIAAISVFFVVITTATMTFAELLRRKAERRNRVPST
ncbi:ABC transporter permease [Rhodobacteraceae bacterium RKSG542]|uniref:ABC transporter permease n=1 Tax=Pseudovibrio flavus TaxID=2529854 RepID=UPI0012BCA140|nr:ABC transporter permease [Pseudovibrio flavus]MTI17482.1 ABC transporter permease [Pseudovibrio flavus]